MPPDPSARGAHERDHGDDRARLPALERAPTREAVAARPASMALQDIGGNGAVVAQGGPSPALIEATERLHAKSGAFTNPDPESGTS